MPNDLSLPDWRIVGGEAVPIASVPWIVSLTILSRHTCGATIISKTRVLTAAHCTINVPIPNLGVRAGSTHINQGGQVIRAARVIKHPQFNKRTMNNDIATVWLQTALNTAVAGVAVIPLPPQNAGVATGAMATVAGWGHLREGGINAPSLRSVRIPIVSPAVCNRMYGGGITNGMLCAGYPEGGRDACQNDSGGPLWLNGRLIGLVAFGEGCGQPNRPGVYTRVSYYRNWINANI